MLAAVEAVVDLQPVAQQRERVIVVGAAQPGGADYRERSLELFVEAGCGAAHDLLDQELVVLPFP